MTDTRTHLVRSRVDVCGNVLRAIDVMKSNIVVGIRDGKILAMDWNENEEWEIVQDSHYIGEIGGLCALSDNLIITTGEDN